ncbi:MAG TPA: adenylate/guanylate cyclase domain-containing protein [Candidatus Cybelea sp.]|nr:adenylate/guanylate cyclase domain-containing protein [Candidatus Cybelea sp.]
MAPPTGAITLLFSDIEGSTQRWEERPEAMVSALHRHDQLLRGAIEANRGHIFKTVGDAFCAAFSHATDGVAAALDAQRALAAEDFSSVGGLAVRIAVHSGTTHERDGDYFGPTVNRVARLLAVVHGEQVVISGETAQLLPDPLPDQAQLLDLGSHRLKDLVEPEHVWQLTAPGLRDVFPPLLSLGSLPNNLPRQVTPLIGRDEVVAEVEALIAQAPLVTLVGTGGVGKTRVALQAGADVLDGSGDGVWFVELAPLSDPSLVAGTIATTLGLREQVERPVLETLLGYLKRKRLLLILDNCEHVIAEAALIAETILRDCPEVRLLATSREALRISGEHPYRMPSLGVPPDGAALTAAAAAEHGAVALFAQRAAISEAKFRLTDENAPLVGEIVRRLDGIPLAIELAAARVKLLTVAQIAKKLDERFAVLTGGSRTALPRQQTMRALIDWSYDLLSAAEQRLFRRLSIFAGGWTLDTASEVCAGDDVLDLLSALVDKSLVVAEPAGEQQRYGLLESTREYARERLAQSGELEAIARGHAEAYLALAERLDDAFDSTPDREWLSQTEPELENWRVALTWSLGARNEVLLGQRLTAKLGDVWHSFGPSEGLRWVRTALELVDETTPPAVVAQLDLAEALLYEPLGRIRLSHIPAQRALSRFHELNDQIGVAYAQHILGSSLAHHGRIADGEELLKAALEVFRKHGARRLTGRTLRRLATARGNAGDRAAARSLYAEALEIFKAAGAERNVALVATFLAEIEFYEGDAEAAVRLAGEALASDRELPDRIRAMFTSSNMAAYLIALDRFDEARERAREALTLAARQENAILVATALQHLAACAALRLDEGEAQADKMRAARLMGFVDAHLTELENQREFTEQQEYDRVIAALQEALHESPLERLMAEGQTWSKQRAIAEGLNA